MTKLLSHDVLFTEVRNWWNERIIEGCQLSSFDGTVEGYDYYKMIDKPQWYRFVATRALYLDCYLNIPEPLRPKFSTWAETFKSATNQTDLVRRKAQIPIRNIEFRPTLVYVRFGKRPLTPLPV